MRRQGPSLNRRHRFLFAVRRHASAVPGAPASSAKTGRDRAHRRHQKIGASAIGRVERSRGERRQAHRRCRSSTPRRGSAPSRPAAAARLLRMKYIAPRCASAKVRAVQELREDDDSARADRRPGSSSAARSRGRPAATSRVAPMTRKTRSDTENSALSAITPSGQIDADQRAAIAERAPMQPAIAVIESVAAPGRSWPPARKSRNTFEPIELARLGQRGAQRMRELAASTGRAAAAAAARSPRRSAPATTLSHGASTAMPHARHRETRTARSRPRSDRVPHAAHGHSRSRRRSASRMLTLSNSGAGRAARDVGRAPRATKISAAASRPVERQHSRQNAARSAAIIMLRRSLRASAMMPVIGGTTTRSSMPADEQRADLARAHALPGRARRRRTACRCRRSARLRCASARRRRRCHGRSRANASVAEDQGTELDKARCGDARR